MSETIFKPVKIRGATILITATTILSNLIGLARDKVIALHFGTSATTDIYNASFLIPDTLFNLFIAGALAAAFMPVFSKYLQEDQKEAMKIANIMATVTSLAILVLSILAFIFMKNIIAISFPNVSVDTQKSIVDMTKLMLPSAIIFAISGILGNILMSYKHFTSYSISPLLYNLGIILGILFLNKSMGIYSAAIGVLIGAILHCLVRILDVIKTPYSYKTTFEIFHPGFKKIIKLMIPRSLTLVVWQINLYIFAVVGMSMITGGLAAFYFARNIQSFAVTIFGISFATAAFPYITESISKGDKKSFTEQMQQAMEKILFFTIPSGIGVIILSKQIVTLVLTGGQFNMNSANLTSLLLFFLGISIPFESLTQILSRGFYAVQNSIIPMITSILSFALIGFATYFIAPIYGIKWFSISYSVGFIVLIILQSILLKKYMEGFNGKNFLKSIAKTILSTGIMAAIILLIQPLETIINIRVAVIMEILLGSGIFFLSAIYLKSPEISGVGDIVKKFLPKKSQ